MINKEIALKIAYKSFWWGELLGFVFGLAIGLIIGVMK